MIKNRRKPISDDAKTALLIVGALDEIQGHGGFLGFGGNIQLLSQGRSDYQALKASDWRPSREAFCRLMAGMCDDPEAERVAIGLMAMLGMYTNDECDDMLAAMNPDFGRLSADERKELYAEIAACHKAHPQAEVIEILFGDDCNPLVKAR
jgi:hypothetical protein